RFRRAGYGPLLRRPQRLTAEPPPHEIADEPAPGTLVARIAAARGERLQQRGGLPPDPVLGHSKGELGVARARVLQGAFDDPVGQLARHAALPELVRQASPPAGSMAQAVPDERGRHRGVVEQPARLEPVEACVDAPRLEALPSEPSLELAPGAGAVG